MKEKISHVVKQDGDFDHIEVNDLGATKHDTGAEEKTKDDGQSGANTNTPI